MANSARKLLQIKLNNGKMGPHLAPYLRDEDPEVRREMLAYVHDIPSVDLKLLVHDPDTSVALQAVHHPEIYEPHLLHALESTDPTVHAAVAGHGKITHAVLHKLLNHQDVPFETKKLAVSSKHLSPDMVSEVIRRSISGANSDDKELAIEALTHPHASDKDRVAYIKSSNDDTKRNVAACVLHSHEDIESLLNDGAVPFSTKAVLLRNPHFNKSRWWRLTDPQVRDMAKELADVHN
jgi:hypothetical protein